jgi:hypothetical protein
MQSLETLDIFWLSLEPGDLEPLYSLSKLRELTVSPLRGEGIGDTLTRLRAAMPKCKIRVLRDG